MSTIDITSFSNCFSSQNDKSIQEYFKNFNDITLSVQDISSDSAICNNTSNALSSFLSSFVQNDLNDDFTQLVNSTTISSGFNPYENVLDRENLYEFAPNEQTCDISDFYGTNDIGYFINADDVSYYNLDSSQSSSQPFEEIEVINQTFEEVKYSIPVINQPKEKVQTKKTKQGGRGRGRPAVEKEKIVEKVARAVKANDKVKIRTEKNNVASKEYRERKANKKKQLDMDLEIQKNNNRKLRKIHAKLSYRIKYLESILQMHPF